MKYPNWVKKNWVTSKGLPLDFERHKYLEQIYRDQSHELVIMKSSQMGISERLVSEAVWLADCFNENALFIQPTFAQLSDFVQERVDQPLNLSSHLREVMAKNREITKKMADKIGMKKMSRGFVYFRGANNENQIISVSADAIFVDELDRMEQSHIAFFDKRLEHSNRRWKRWVSTPTIPDYGIHKIYRRSDQHEYHLTCNSCQTEQVLTFEDNVDKERILLVCRSCKEELITWQCKGQWIPKVPDNKVRGYYINQLYSPSLNVAELIEQSERSSEFEVQQFVNQVLGLPYAPKGARIDDVMLKHCIKDYTAPLYDEWCYMGVDVGKRLHVIIRTKKRILFIGTVSDFFGASDSLEDLIRKWKPKKVVVDALPETHEVGKLCSMFRNKVYICYYSGLTEPTAEQWFKERDQKINTNRLLAIDRVFDEIRSQKVELPKNLDDYPEFKKQLRSTVRIITTDSKGNARPEYKETGADHFLHTSVYALIASSIFVPADPEIFFVKWGKGDDD